MKYKKMEGYGARGRLKAAKKLNGCVQRAQKGKEEEAKNHLSDTPCTTDVIPFAFPGERQFSRADVILIPFFFRIQQVGNEAYVLGLSSFHVPSIAAACVCFLELLGLDSLKLRVDMKMANIILSYKCGNEDAQYSFIRESLGTAPFLYVVWFV